MRYELQVNKKDNTFFKKSEDGKVFYKAMNEEGKTNFVDKDLIMNHLLDIDNVRYTKDGKIYPCRSKQGVVLRYLIDQIKASMRTECYEPVNLLRLTPTYFIRDNQGIYRLKSSQFSLENVAQIEEGMKKKEFKMGKNIDCVVALLQRYRGVNTDDYYRYAINYNTFDNLLFSAIEEEIIEGRYVMYIWNRHSDMQLFISRKDPNETYKIWTTLCEKTEKQGGFLDGCSMYLHDGVQDIKSVMSTVKLNFSYSRHFEDIEIGENIT